jgi:hypothetical protein
MPTQAVPVDYDPFKIDDLSSSLGNGVVTTPVDHNPFAAAITASTVPANTDYMPQTVPQQSLPLPLDHGGGGAEGR